MRGTKLAGFHVRKICGRGCRWPGSTAPGGALSLYVGGVYLRTEVKPPAGRFYEIKRERLLVQARHPLSFIISTSASRLSLLCEGAFLVI